MDDFEVPGLLSSGDGFDWGWGSETSVPTLGPELAVPVFCCEVDLALAVDAVSGSELISTILAAGGTAGSIHG